MPLTLPRGNDNGLRIVTFQFSDEFSGERIRRIADQAQAKFKDMPGLRSKVFGIAADRRQARNVYLWNDGDAARAFFTPNMREQVTALYGVAPTVEFSEVLASVEN